MNGTADEITEAGIKLKNAYLYAYQSNSLGTNLFSDIRYGIIAQGSFSHIGASYLRMERIKRIGISMEEGSLQLKDSRFEFCEFYGIRFGLAKLVDIQNTVITISDTPSPELRIGIFFNQFGLNADVKINNFSFGADLDGSISPVRGIQLRGNNSGAGTKIRIDGCTFSFQAASSGGIIIIGPFSASTVTEIWNNRFYVSSIYSEPAGNLRSAGISVDGNGNINNLSIKWNTFTSHSVHVFPPGVIGIPQWNWGIDLRSNSMGTNNEVSVNSFNYEVQPLGQGLLVRSFQNTRYCSNTFSGYGFSTAALFSGNCADTDLTGNIFNYVAPGIGGVLDLYGNPAIGLQEHKGNKWYNLFGLEPYLHVRCDGNPLLNKFIVHTPQSTCANENDPCFSPYHPRKIEPDLMNELFEQQIGSPSPGCDYETPAPVVINGLDLLIAQNQIAIPPDDPSAAWVLQRHLYQKLRDNPGLVAGHPAFAPFLTNYENSSVGRFYEVHKTMEEAVKADAGIHAQSKLALADISALADSIGSIDLAIEQQGETEALTKSKEELIAQIHSLYWDYDSLALVYRSQVSANLQSAYNLNQTVPVSTVYETNQKTVNQIFLQSLMQNNGEFTQEQVAGLESIALQDANIGGPAVHTAWGLLPECLKEEIEPQYKVRNLSPDMEVAALSSDVKPITEAAVSIYPNPANSSLTVRHTGKNKGTLMLADMTGKIWLRRQITGDSTLLDIGENTPVGIYLLRLFAEDGSSFVKKVVIQQK
ncbi:MAG TPA: T9SS type A sorting domain-containing protein [Flavilitoribacter sp.]|nr:T9SS type A sorting domain-containing protein [Flavilitoribacter sp.]HMQ88988.1 T9SS type A sorting domain-containing protein [Flavilitoribacter sp.]